MWNKNTDGAFLTYFQEDIIHETPTLDSTVQCNFTAKMDKEA